MPYNPLAITAANATPEQIAITGRGVNTAEGAYNSDLQRQQNDAIMRSLLLAREKEEKRRQNKAYADVGQVAGALAGFGLAGGMAGQGLLGAGLGAGLGGAIAGGGQSGSNLIPGALMAARGIQEGNRLHGLGNGTLRLNPQTGQWEEVK